MRYVATYYHFLYLTLSETQRCEDGTFHDDVFVSHKPRFCFAQAAARMMMSMNKVSVYRPNKARQNRDRQVSVAQQGITR